MPSILFRTITFGRDHRSYLQFTWSSANLPSSWPRTLLQYGDVMDDVFCRDGSHRSICIQASLYNKVCSNSLLFQIPESTHRRTPSSLRCLSSTLYLLHSSLIDEHRSQTYPSSCSRWRSSHTTHDLSSHSIRPLPNLRNDYSGAEDQRLLSQIIV